MDKLPESDFPISLQLDLATGLFETGPARIERRLSVMAPLFYDQEAVAEISKQEDRLIYDMYHYYFDTSLSDMSTAVSRIQAGKIGDEYFMTKGHFHALNNQPEIYFCLQGEGYLLLETREGEFRSERWTPGTVTHIPAQWAHRVVNTGEDILFYISAFHKSAGHDYELIEQRGFSQVVVERDGKPVFVPNPRRQV
jgi:glucose-6-phosphate isomerase